MRLLLLPLVILALAGLLAGCHTQVPSRLGERAVVKGRVTVRGAPVPRGTVVFTPVPRTANAKPATVDVTFVGQP